MMQRTSLDFDKRFLDQLPKFAVAAIILAVCFPTLSLAEAPNQKTFTSPEAACMALVAAAQNNDEKTMLAILGPDAKQIVSSGDDAQDAENRANFVAKYLEMHRLVEEPDGTEVMYIGAENWPTPIPLVKDGDSWRFDTEAGKQEILYRRIGRNELSAIRICQELAAAQKEYYSARNNQYPQKVISDDGQRNGLYWKSAPGEPESFIGPLLAVAFVDVFTTSPTHAPTPYRGYFFRAIPLQGKHDSGAATGGFAFVAYPAEYRSSGVMSFVVNQDGLVYQKDLGKSTESSARGMKEYNPAGWDPAEEEPAETAEGEQAQ